ncbi:MAG: 5'/3'-nucleotidase SurE [Halobacteriovoraceae bacterium]|nr:5'/3'-nucleotidase SurE [Halobacteriovoraceae bacterium]
MKRILMTNDDGVNAPGINSLFKVIKNINSDTFVVAPLEERSTTGHSLSLDKPLRLQHIDENIYGCTGYTADCVLMGIGHILKDKKPNLVLSGINRGANLGQDLYYSGTMAGAREAAFHGFPSVAVSLVCDMHHDTPFYYETAAKVMETLIELNIEKYIPKLSMINVNVPNIPFEELKGVKCGKMGFRYYSEEIEPRIDSRNRDYYWVVGKYEGFRKMDGTTDSELVDNHFVSVVPLPVIMGEQIDFSAIHEIIGACNERISL